MPLDPHFPPFLARLTEAGWTPLVTGDAVADRDRYRRLSLVRRGEGYRPEPVADVEDRTIEGPAGDLAVRVYRSGLGRVQGGRTPGAARPVVVWLHGGGWAVGDLDTHDPVCRAVANRLGATVVAVDYRLAPEHPHPAPLEDAMAALRWAARRWPTAPLVVAGDSAGAALAAGCAIRARDEDGPVLAAQLLAYPCLDPSQSMPSVAENGTDLFLEASDMATFYDWYVPGDLARDPLVAPLGSDLTGLPPAVVATAEFDPLRDEGDTYAVELAAAGVPVVHLPGPGLVHGYFGLTEVAPSAAVRRAEVLDVLADLLGTPGGSPDGEAWPTTEPLGAWLERGAARVAVDLRGGGLRRLAVGDWDVLDGYPTGVVPKGRRGGLLLPWPNRLREGRWSWEGADLQLDTAGPGGHAMHGLLSWQPFTVLDRTQDSVTVGTVLEPRSGYPFRLAVALDYRLDPGRLSVTVRVRNAGTHPAPFGVGMHPYLHVGAQADGDVGLAELHVPATTALDVDGGLPTGGRTPFDGAVGVIGDRELDDPLTDLVRDEDGWARVRLAGPAGSLELAVDEQWPWLQVYSGDTLPEGQRRRSLAVEPMTCPPNALADDADLVVLAPEETWSGSWTLSWTPAAG
ncbi:alpha/beta hydrolase fold domain-containing protein [Modestobacter sp. Leaf380]|uniref:aldose epimerase family protein n=1 Tax=Modestobacter sp. Leaf380 TaxID=1736356 RepID=UPI00190FFDCE|nr:alpha/beta hydrolase fold domain-containing protein [Modestobacter sp. Leaf380]